METVWTMDVAGRLFENRDAGYSCRPDGTIPVDGYMVGVPRFGAVIPTSVVTSEEVLRLIEAYVTKLWGIACRDGLYFGIWKDEGKIYLDMSERCNSRTFAVGVAQQRGEIAIYDVAGEREIRV